MKIKFDDELKVPYVDKKIVDYLKEVYTNRELLNMVKNDEAEMALGFMYGVQHVIDRLNVIVHNQEGD